MPTHVLVNGLGLTHKGTIGFSTATIPDVCKTPSPGGPVPIPYPNFAQHSSLTDGTTTVFAKSEMIAVTGSHYSSSNGDEAGTAGGVKSNVNMKATDWITYSFDVKMDGQNACRHTDKKFHNNQNTVDLAGNIDPDNPPAGLTPHELALWKPCATQHEKYKKIQRQEAAHGTDRYNELETLLERESRLLERHPIAPKILTQAQRDTFNRLNKDKIVLLEKLCAEREKYIEMGCDDVRWPDEHGTLATTTAAERRNRHYGELNAMKRRLNAMTGLFA
jgi:hypothetical protein